MVERFLGNISVRISNFLDKAMERAYQNTLEFYEVTPQKLKDEKESIRKMELEEARKRESS